MYPDVSGAAVGSIFGQTPSLIYARSNPKKRVVRVVTALPLDGTVTLVAMMGLRCMDFRNE